MQFIATTAYAFEGILAAELRNLGYEPYNIQTSRVSFDGEYIDGVRASIHLRSAGKVRLVLKEFNAETFDQLYDNIYSLDYKSIFPKNARIDVNARCLKSELMSIPDTQRITKKAIVDKMCKQYTLPRLNESGVICAIETHIWNDNAVVSLDIVGDPLHKRGYRKLNPPAALRETFAAGLVLASNWKSDLPFADPFCGSGTIAIEAAMIARNIPPGLNRGFIGEKYGFIKKQLWNNVKKEAKSNINNDDFTIFGGDINDKVLKTARYHAKLAGVADTIHFQKQDVSDYYSKKKYGHIVTNPPYGVRISDRNNGENVYRKLAKTCKKLDTWTFHVLTPERNLERIMGKRAGRRRAMRNGPINCTFYQFWGPRPRYNREEE